MNNEDPQGQPERANEGLTLGEAAYSEIFLISDYLERIAIALERIAEHGIGIHNSNEDFGSISISGTVKTSDRSW